MGKLPYLGKEKIAARSADRRQGLCHWIIEKEPLEISFREDTAKERYDAFLKKYPNLFKRLKKHHIASFLGITPTQLSRIFFANK